MAGHDGVTGLIGLAKKAGALSSGAEGVRGLARSGRARLVLLASDCSPNARKRIENCCANYGVRMLRAPMTMYEMGAAIGSSPCCAVAVSDKGFAGAIIDKGAAIWQ